MKSRLLLTSLTTAAALGALTPSVVAAIVSPGACDQACLEKIGDRYRAAYVKHDPSLAPISKAVRFTENNVGMKFPDASWDAVTAETGPAITFSDPATGTVGIYTGVTMLDTPAYLAVRLKVENGEITEIEHILATKRLVSTPPTVFGDVAKLAHDPEVMRVLEKSERVSRAEMIKQADGYFSTLANNDGTLRGGVKFLPSCRRMENGTAQAREGCEAQFKTGNFRFNERVRDREYFLVDEERGLVMGRAFIDHKGALDSYKLTDGTEKKSIFREPHTWSVLEMFKIVNGAIGPIEADFIGVPYRTRTPWTKNPE